MSFQSKLKRAFLKAHKIFICFICFIIVLSSILCVSAEKQTHLVNCDVTKVQIAIVTETTFEQTSWYTIDPRSFVSPTGGTFYGARLPDNVFIDDAREWNINIYFDKFSMKAGHTYDFNLNFVMPYDKIVNPDNGIFNVYNLSGSLNDDTRAMISRLDTSSAGTRYGGTASNWQVMKMQDFGEVEWGFYNIQFSVTPGRDFTAWFFNFFIHFSIRNSINSRGNFGISDAIYITDVDPLTDPGYSGFGSDSDFEDYQDFENSMGSAAEDGIDDTNAALDLSGDGFADLFSGLLVWAKFIDYSLNDMLWYDILLRFGLALGLFSFILGLGNSVVSFVRNRDSTIRREATRIRNKNRRGG